MWEGVRSTVRASWLAVALAAALSISLPAAASTHPGAEHSAARTTVLAAEGSRRPARDKAPPPHTGWDAASLLIDVPAGEITARRNPWRSAAPIGQVAAVSKYYHVPIVLWVARTNAKATWGRVQLPYVWPRVNGWIPLAGLGRASTFVHVDVDVSEHRVRVYKHDELLYSVTAATGTSSSATPPGAYVVTDRVPFGPGSALGSFAFGISGIQPNLPAGWSGGNQLAIHGTNDPSSLGTSASAGCVRVSEWALDRFKPLLRLGTPVVIHA